MAQAVRELVQRPLFSSRVDHVVRNGRNRSSENLSAVDVRLDADAPPPALHGYDHTLIGAATKTHDFLPGIVPQERSDRLSAAPSVPGRTQPTILRSVW